MDLHSELPNEKMEVSASAIEMSDSLVPRKETEEERLHRK